MQLKSATGAAASAATPTTAPPRADKLDVLDFREAREEMIRVAAYYLAEQRGFAPGGELEDWLIAESEIDAILNE